MSIETIQQGNSSLPKAEQGVLAFNTYCRDMPGEMASFFQACRKLLEAENLKENELLERSKRVLSSFLDSSVSIPNPFIIAGFLPNEDSWSNAIAIILDPIRSRGLHLNPLKEIVRTIAAKGNEDAVNILELLSVYKGSVSVNCRVHCNDTIPDIVIRGEGFLIYIESKMRWGSETVNSEGITQTERQANDLAKRSYEDGVKTLGIYLSPNGMRATSTKFASLSRYELVDAIRKAIQASESGYKGKLIMEAFIDTFQLLY